MTGRPIVVIGVLIYVCLLHWVYTSYIPPIFSDSIYHYLPAPVLTLLIHGLVACLPSLWMPLGIRRPSQMVYWVHYVALYIPSVMIPMYAGTQPPMVLLLYSFLFLALFGVWGAMYSVPEVSLPRIRTNRTGFLVMVYCAAAVVLLYALASYGVPEVTFSFKEIYNVREQFQGSLEESGILIAYLTGWAGNIVNPLLIAYGLVDRKFLPLALGVFGQILLFAITGMKVVIFSCLMIVAIAFLLRKRGQHFGVKVVYGCTVLIIACLFLDSLSELPWATSLFARRLLIVPGLLTGYYLDFFSDHAKLFMSDNTLSYFFDYPYNLPITNVIGFEYLYDVESSANANFWASGFAHFGVVGIVLCSLALCLFLWIYDCLARGRDLRIATLLLGIPAIALANGSLQTTLLSHGMGLALLLVFFMPPKPEMPHSREFTTEDTAPPRSQPNSDEF